MLKKGYIVSKLKGRLSGKKHKMSTKKKIQREVTKDHCPQMFYTDANCLSLLGEGDEVL